MVKPVKDVNNALLILPAWISTTAFNTNNISFASSVVNNLDSSIVTDGILYAVKDSLIAFAWLLVLTKTPKSEGLIGLDILFSTIT